MKAIVVLLIISISFLLGSDDLLDNFINQQIGIEAKLQDQNLSQKEIKKIRDTQKDAYKEFFLDFATDKTNYTEHNNTYSKEISKLKIRRNFNLRKGYKLASMRDEVKIQEYLIRQGIRNFLQKVLLQTRNKSKKFFEDKINDMIATSFSDYTPLKEKKYLEALKKNRSSAIAPELQKELQTLNNLESVINTFSSQLIDNSSKIYEFGKITQSRFFALVDKINQYPSIKKLNNYLSIFNINTIQILILIVLIIVIVFINLIARFSIDRVLRYRKVNEEEISYIHSHITKLIYIITSILIIHLAVVFYFGIDSKSFSISKFFGVAYVVLIALLLYRITDTVAYLKMESLQQSKILKKEVFNLLIKMTYALIVLAAVIAILVIFGIDLTALLSGLGIGGFAVAFAAKDSIANIFGSVSILLGNLFEQGDWIEIGNIDGTVVEIGLRATTLRTFDNALISIPNFKLANEGIKNWSRRTIGRRIKMHIGVTYESNFDDIRQAIDDIRKMIMTHPDIAGSNTKYFNKYRTSRLLSTEDFRGIKRTSLVYMDEFADSSINILIYCFSKSVVWSEWLEVKEDVMYKIADILRKNHLEFAYPALAVHNVSDKHRDRDEDEDKADG